MLRKSLTMMRYALLLAAVFCSQATAVEVNEAVLEEGAIGTAVVLLSVANIQQAAIFPDDNQLLRRIAYVETRDGTISNGEGGIWAVSEAAFESTKDTSNALLVIKHEQILQQFTIVWQSVQLSDLRRPLYSALAARLVLFTSPQAIPSDTDVTGQAQFWRDNYNTDGNTDEFAGAARKLQGGNFPNSASDIYVGFARNDHIIIGMSYLQLFVSTKELDPVLFTVDTLLGFNFTGVATRDSTTVVPLEISYRVVGSSERNKGIRVSAGDKQIDVYGLNYYRFTADAFTAVPCSLPMDQYEYYAITYHNAFQSQLLFVGCEDNTAISFASTVITLNQMETYLYETHSDITGTHVVSNKPISVFSGHVCSTIGQGTCDHLVEQIPPTATWGTKFLSASFKSRSSGEIYRILASQPSTTVTVNCTTYTQPETYSLATAGAWQEFNTPDDSFCVIESNKPLLVAVYALSNSESSPFMLVLPPAEQYSNNYVFNAPAEFESNFITIFVPSEYFETENIFVDGISQEQNNWTAIHCLDRTVCGYAAYASLEVGDHRLYHSDPLAIIGVSAYGFIFGNSYGYPGSLQVVPIQLTNISFLQESYFVGENEKTVNVSVVRSGNTKSRVVVLVASDPNEGSATAGQDYSAVIEILEFLPEETKKEVIIRIFEDTHTETNESFVLYLSNGAGIFLSPFAQIQVTVIDNDVPCDPPCENGVCLANNICDCSEGYTGDTCADRVPCDPPCDNGVCLPNNTCDCSKEYTGDTCAESASADIVDPKDSGDDIIILGISTAAAVVALLVSSVSATVSIICWRRYHKLKGKQNVPVTCNLAYEDVSTVVHNTECFGRAPTLAQATAHEETTIVPVARNVTYDDHSLDIPVDCNVSYEDCSLDIPVSQNSAYCKYGQDIPVSHNTAAHGDVSEDGADIYEEI